MNTKPRVSVIMIFLNAAKFITEAIESVFAQTYDNWELLLVDDGSTDKSTDIALRYSQQYPAKVRYLEHEGHQNKGMSPSRNVGIGHANGELIALLDADDVWLPEKLEKQVAIMDQDPEVGLVFNALLHLYDDGPREPQPATLSPGKNSPGVWISKMLESDDNGACPSSVLLRKSLALGVGGFEESFRGAFQLFEDQAMWNKVGLNTFIYFAPEPLVLYRMHVESWWGKSSYYEQQFARLHLYAWLINYIKTNNNKYLKELYAAIERFHLVLIRYLVDMNQIEAAVALIPSLEQQTPESPKGAEWNYLAAFGLHKMGINLQNALARYNYALEHGFNEFWIRCNRGSLFLQLGEIAKARADLERAIALRPDHEGAQQGLKEVARQLVNRQELPAAIQLLDKILAINPEMSEARYLLGYALSAAGIREEEAVVNYNVALEKGYDEFWVRYNRGSLHARLGNLDQARADLERAVELRPDHEGAHLMLQQLLQKEKE